LTRLVKGDDSRVPGQGKGGGEEDGRGAGSDSTAFIIQTRDHKHGASEIIKNLQPEGGKGKEKGNVRQENKGRGKIEDG